VISIFQRIIQAPRLLMRPASHNPTTGMFTPPTFTKALKRTRAQRSPISSRAVRIE